MITVLTLWTICSALAADQPPVFTRRTVYVPFDTDGWDLDKIKAVRLMCSKDGGKSWSCEEELDQAYLKPRRVGVFVVERRGFFFTFRAPTDGVYWLCLQKVFTDGSTSPERPSPAVKIRIRTEKH